MILISVAKGKRLNAVVKVGELLKFQSLDKR